MILLTVVGVRNSQIMFCASAEIYVLCKTFGFLPLLISLQGWHETDRSLFYNKTMFIVLQKQVTIYSVTRISAYISNKAKLEAKYMKNRKLKEIEKNWQINHGCTNGQSEL